MKTKNIKVVYTYRHHQSGGVLHSGTGPCTAVPKIQMEGHWLEALGFSIGAPLIVEYEEGSIRIRTLTAEELAAKEQQEAQAELEKRIAQLEQMKHGIEAEAASLSMVAEPSTKYAASEPDSRN
ncbi:type I addiction module toxin, SymE family [Anaerotruncus sp. 1XD22-93]|nr:type I addiction module toxin, SymE family [Lachnospiraceae bacterium]NBI74049.1 type I addiction module toxin, SymE family [Lachnospiraceae bacterium]RKK00237.1 type I addiction module toxin, SymE family [Anaerotruncus sp. 1XD22-93]